MPNHETAPMPAERLGVKQAAAYLGFENPATLYNQRSAGVGPRSYKIGSRVWYDVRDLDLYIAQCKAATLVGA